MNEERATNEDAPGEAMNEESAMHKSAMVDEAEMVKTKTAEMSKTAKMSKSTEMSETTKVPETATTETMSPKAYLRRLRDLRDIHTRKNSCRRLMT